MINISEVIGRKTKWPRFFGLSGICYMLSRAKKQRKWDTVLSKWYSWHGMHQNTTCNTV